MKMTAIEKLYVSLWCRLGRVLDLLTEDDGHIADEIDPVRYELHNKLPDSYKSRSFEMETLPPILEEMRQDSDRLPELIPATYEAVKELADSVEIALDGAQVAEYGGRKLNHLDYKRMFNALQRYKDAQ